MQKYKIVLNQMLDLGGLATKGNFYSPKANTVLGALVHTRKVFDDLEGQNLIVPLKTVTRVRNLSQEEFYAITKLGAKVVDRVKDYTWKGGVKSPYNIMHESMVRDIALSFLRQYHEYIFEFSYIDHFEGLKPDIVIRMTHKDKGYNYIFMVEVERKKTVDRVVNEKLMRYEKVLANLNFKKHSLNAPVKVLFFFANLDYNCFLRPQEYNNPQVKGEIEKLDRQLLHLVRLSRNFPDGRYRFLTFPNFYRLSQQIWYTPSQRQVKLL